MPWTSGLAAALFGRFGPDPSALWNDEGTAQPRPRLGDPLLAEIEEPAERLAARGEAREVDAPDVPAEELDANDDVRLALAEPDEVSRLVSAVPVDPELGDVPVAPRLSAPDRLAETIEPVVVSALAEREREEVEGDQGREGVGDGLPVERVAEGVRRLAVDEGSPTDREGDIEGVESKVPSASSISSALRFSR